MKKTLLLLPFAILALSGCNNKDNDEITDGPKESVQLALQNFSKYVAINESSTSIAQAGSGSFVIYYASFTGADYCKFVDCVVSYKFENSNYPELFVAGTATLNLSGDGEAKPYYPGSTSRDYHYVFSVTAVKGTVLVYR